MSIPHTIRDVAREAYRHAMFTGQYEQTHGRYQTDVHAVEGYVAVRHDGQRWNVPIAKSWL